MTSSLAEVSGGSTGFTIEAAWYGYLADYTYSGSSSPETGWLPSYPLGKGLQIKAKLEKIALKTVAAEIYAAEQLGFNNPTTYNSDNFPDKIIVESSNWFLE